MDKELQKIARILKRIDDLENFMYSSSDGSNGTFSSTEMNRIRKYIASRKKYFFDWLLEV